MKRNTVSALVLGVLVLLATACMVAPPDPGASVAAKPAPKTSKPGKSPTPTTTTVAPAPPPTTVAPAPPPTTVAPAPLPTVENSRIGFSHAYLPLTLSAADLAADFDAIAATGAKWVRFDFYWSNVQPASRDRFDWTAIDRAVNAARSRGLNVLGMLAYTPTWARPANTTDHHPPTNPDDFANFAGAAARRYAPLGVRSWEIWNEPNVGNFWSPKPNVVAYTDLLKRSYAAITAADPGATVLTGGTAPAGGTLDWTSPDGTQVSPWRFLKGIYDNGGRGSFTAVAHHPYTGMPYGPSTTATWNSFQHTDDLHDLMASYGDGAKKVWGTEAGSWTGTSSNAVTEAVQADFVKQYISGWNAWSSFTGPFFYYSLRDRGTNLADREDNFGLLRYDRSEKPAMAAFRQVMSG
jgi:hypothetical protein